MSEQRSYRVLLVDDDAVDREMVSRGLSRCELPVYMSSVATATAGLEALGDAPWDCVFVDYRLPEGDALALFDHVLRRDCSERPPFVLLTGFGGEAVAVDAMKRGFQDYLRKGDVNPAALRDALESAVARAEAAAARETHTRELQRRSFQDELTGLANRALYTDRLTQRIRQAERARESFAVLLIDLDRFKEVNDTLGHEAGDEVLVEVARRVRAGVRESDTIARLGGDEFALLLPSTDSCEGARVVAHKLHQSICEPMTAAGSAVQVGASIGIALWSPESGGAAGIMRAADGAMYEAKRAGRPWAVHEAGSTPPPARAAVTTGRASGSAGPCGFEIAYQPQIELASGRVVGAEALLRWRHPELGLLPPMDLLPPVDLVPAAEGGGRLEAVMAEIIGRALADLAAWRSQGLDIGVSVNVPPRALAEPRLAERISQTLRHAAVEPSLLTLEVSEAQPAGALSGFVEGVSRLKRLGVRLAIDDFGTGLTSPEALRSLPLDELKIDRAFIETLADEEPDTGNGRSTVIVRSVLELARAIGARVVAEGIESESQRERLVQLGCGHGQGYRFSPAIDASELGAWMRRWDERSGREPPRMQAQA